MKRWHISAESLNRVGYEFHLVEKGAAPSLKVGDIHHVYRDESGKYEPYKVTAVEEVE